VRAARAGWWFQAPRAAWPMLHAPSASAITCLSRHRRLICAPQCPQDLVNFHVLDQLGSEVYFKVGGAAWGSLDARCVHPHAAPPLARHHRPCKGHDTRSNASPPRPLADRPHRDRCTSRPSSAGSWTRTSARRASTQPRCGAVLCGTRVDEPPRARARGRYAPCASAARPHAPLRRCRGRALAFSLS
jgi:hypothetical protein